MTYGSQIIILYTLKLYSAVCQLWSGPTHVHWVDDAIQPSHPLPPSSLPAFNQYTARDLLSTEEDLLPVYPPSSQILLFFKTQLNYVFLS